MIKYMSLAPQFGLVTGTLGQSLAGVSAFIVIFCFLFLGFATAFLMVLGSNMYEYRSLMQCFFALLKALLGDFDLDAMQEVHWIAGPVLFLFFVAIAVFVILNL